jgi:hypothetical protein
MISATSTGCKDRTAGASTLVRAIRDWLTWRMAGYKTVPMTLVDGTEVMVSRIRRGSRQEPQMGIGHEDQADEEYDDFDPEDWGSICPN